MGLKGFWRRAWKQEKNLTNPFLKGEKGANGIAPLPLYQCMNLPNGRALGRQAVMFQAYSRACYQAFTKLTHKYTGEFGMRDVHYVDYRVALVGEITIRFFLILLKKAS